MPARIIMHDQVETVELGRLKCGSVVSLPGFPGYLYMIVDVKQCVRGICEIVQGAGERILLDLSNALLISAPANVLAQVYDVNIHASLSSVVTPHLSI